MVSKEEENWQRPFDRNDIQMILLYMVWFVASIILVVWAGMRGA